MSHPGRIDRDLVIPHGPRGSAWRAALGLFRQLPRGAPSRPRPGPVQEACRVGFVPPSSACAAAEAAFLLWG